MKRSTITKLSIFIAVALISGIFSIHGNVLAQQTSNSSGQSNSTSSSMPNMASPMTEKSNPNKVTVSRDMVTVLLEGKHLAPNDYIELYDSTPYKIVNGHFVAKVPCDAQGKSSVSFLTGVAPDFKMADAELVAKLSHPGSLCLYHVDLISDAKSTITDVAIQNNSTKEITFPQSSSAGVGINEIAPLPPGQG